MIPAGVSPHAAGFLVTTAMWMVMMVVMMLPAVLPWFTGFAALSRDRESGSLRASWVALFGLGYFAAWSAFSVVGASLQIGLRSGGLLAVSAFGASPASAATLAAPLAGMVLVGAGLYQVTPSKTACLEHCRTPMSFFLSRWRNGPVGAFHMGASHGAYCVGCCWALMLTGFALGVMNLAWMAVLTVVIAVETLAPWGDRIGRVAGAALVVWGLVLLGRGLGLVAGGLGLG
jgi:predicted metal-binding membrane protein